MKALYILLLTLALALTSCEKPDPAPVPQPEQPEQPEQGGKEEDKEEDKEEGKEEGKNRINLLNQKLMEEGRLEDLKQSIQDKEYQQQLLKEYNI